MAEEEAHERLKLINPDGNLQWKVIPMGALSSYPIFLAMMTKLQTEWDKLAKERGIRVSASKIIVDDVLLYGRTATHLL